jgi:hypothetical protein
MWEWSNMSVGAFGIEKEGLEELLKEAACGKSQLPEFQRGWVWPDRNIASLIPSISLGYPVGTVMMLRTGGSVKFKERPVEGATFNPTVKADRLVLDGQQRITSLYRALMHQGPIQTQDIRKKAITGWFYVNMKAALREDDEREDSIILLTEDKRVRTFGGVLEGDYSTSESEYAHLMFPLNKVFDWQDWYTEYLEYWDDKDPSAGKLFLKFLKEFINKFDKYQVPVIELPSDTAKDAVCQVFEKVNTGGVTLTVFELLTATYAADEYDLREDWENKKKKWNVSVHKVVSDFSNTDLLQAICLLSTRERRESFLDTSAEAERAPRIGCKRTDMLALTLEDYRTHSNSVVDGLIQASKFLHETYIFDAKFLPYGAQLIPLSAIFSILGNEAENHQARAKICQWFWCGIFGELYGGTTETRFAFDVVEVVNWVRGSAEIPRSIQEAQFVKARLWTLRSRNSAAYKGLYALLLADDAKDWLSGKSVNQMTYFDDSIDVHHIFPKDWCESVGIQPQKYNSILNKTPLSARTNRVIGGKAPSIYITALAEIVGGDLGIVLNAITSHRVDSNNLLQNDFDSHMEFRAIELLFQVNTAMGKTTLEGSITYVADDDDLQDDGQ